MVKDGKIKEKGNYLKQYLKVFLKKVLLKLEPVTGKKVTEK